MIYSFFASKSLDARRVFVTKKSRKNVDSLAIIAKTVEVNSVSALQMGAYLGVKIIKKKRVQKDS